jgi:hypothetical protein
MQGERSNAPDFPPATPMSRERLEMLLIEARNGASMTILGVAPEQIESLRSGEQVEVQPPGEGITGDQRAVWHATEIALGVLRPGYLPKREALHDVERMLAWLDGKDDDWPTTS